MNPPGVFTMQPPEMATPLVAFINPKSGSNQGVKLITQLQGILNPRQVFNLLEKKPGGGTNDTISYDVIQIRDISFLFGFLVLGFWFWVLGFGFCEAQIHVDECNSWCMMTLL